MSLVEHFTRCLGLDSNAIGQYWPGRGDLRAFGGSDRRKTLSVQPTTEVLQWQAVLRAPVATRHGSAGMRIEKMPTFPSLN